MDFFTSSSNSIRYPRFPERYCETAEGAISSILDASTCDMPQRTSSAAIAARIAGNTSHTIFWQGDSMTHNRIVFYYIFRGEYGSYNCEWVAAADIGWLTSALPCTCPGNEKNNQTTREHIWYP
jgi:hypothetical protein